MAEIKARPADRYNGSPMIPTGNPMVDGIGPAAWADRSDTPDLTVRGKPKIVPMGKVAGYSIADGDPDPRGLPVKSADGAVAGTIEDVWVDQSEPQVRYYQVKLASGKGSRLLPIGFAQWPNLGLFGLDHVRVKALTAPLFDGIPTTRSDAQITLLEEDKIMAYYAGGHLYAMPDRSQPLL